MRISMPLGAIGLVCIFSSVQAAVVTQSFTFDAGDFSCFSGSIDPCTPVDSVSGSFTVTYDNAVDTAPGGAVLDEFNLTINGTIYDETNVLFDYMLLRPIGWNAPSISIYHPITGGSVDFGTDDFALTFQVSPTVDRVAFSYAEQGGDDIYVAGLFRPGTYANVTLVPIPAAAWLFGSSLALLSWHRRKTFRDSAA